jgi:ribose transport system substrate-binding protein
MHAGLKSGRDLKGIAAIVAVIPLLLAACSSGASPSPSAASAPPSQAGTASEAPAASAPANDKKLELAYISFAVANSYDAPMLAAAKAAATAGNANLTVFDGALDPPTQVKQLQDAIASGKYDGIILQPVYGPALVPGAQQAIAAGIPIGNIDQILGSDNTTAKSQVDGQLVNVVFVPSELGRKIGEMVVEACADANPCNVGYIWSVKAAALDQTLKQAFDKAISVNPNIKVVAEGESFYTTPAGLAAAQNMLTAHPDLTVITGADQAITGAVQAVKDAGVADKVKLVGYGGGAIAFQDIANGIRYGTTMQAPATEGGLGTQMFIDAIRSGTPAEGIDVLADLPDGGVVTKANVDKFLTLAEWPG